MDPAGRRMLHTDAFAWYMETDPVLRSTVVAVARLDGEPDWPYVRQRLERAGRIVPTFRMRVVEPPVRVGPPRWVLDDRFDLDYHVRQVRAPSPGDWAGVLELARIAAMADFDRARPLWEFTLVSGLADGGTALLMKLHHSLTDGIGGIDLATLVVDPTAEMPPLGPPVALPDTRPPSAVEVVRAAVRDAAADLGTAGRVAGRVAAGEALRGLRAPRSATAEVARMASSVWKVSQPVNDMMSPTMTGRSTQRRLATIDVPFDQAYEAAHAAGASVNDVFLSALTGGLYRYHRRHRGFAPQLRVILPISTRRPGDERGGNRIALVRFPLPVGVRDPLERLHAVREIVHRWRDEPAIPHMQPISYTLNLFPRAYIGGIFRRMDFVASDVPGFRTKVYLGGARVDGYYAFGPTIGAALNATLMSYADRCCVGLNLDTAAVPDTDTFVTCVEEGFHEVLGVARRRRRPERRTARPGEGH